MSELQAIQVYRWRRLVGFCKKYNAKVYEDGDDAVGCYGFVCMKDGRAFVCPEEDHCPILRDDFDVDWFEFVEVQR